MNTDTNADRRERIATAALAAIISKAPLVAVHDNDESWSISVQTAQGAIVYADALIAKLDARAESEAKVPQLAPKAPEPPQGAKTGTSDDYPADVLKACPKAKEWGVVLWGPSSSGHYEWRSLDGCRCWALSETWNLQYAPHMGNLSSKEEALANPPTVPPPGYVEPKPEPASSTLDRLAEVAFDADPANAYIPKDHFYNNVQNTRTVYRNIAHAVRMAVLMEEPSEAEGKAAWSYYSVSSKDSRGAMKVALTAAREARIDAAKKEKP